MLIALRILMGVQWVFALVALFSCGATQNPKLVAQGNIVAGSSSRTIGDQYASCPPGMKEKSGASASADCKAGLNAEIRDAKGSITGLCLGKEM